jgi:hypothetical protein
LPNTTAPAKLHQPMGDVTLILRAVEQDESLRAEQLLPLV